MPEVWYQIYHVCWEDWEYGLTFGLKVMWKHSGFSASHISQKLQVPCSQIFFCKWEIELQSTAGFERVVQVYWKVQELFACLWCHKMERVHQIQIGFLHKWKRTRYTARQQYSTSAQAVLPFAFDIWISKLIQNSIQDRQAPMLNTVWTEYFNTVMDKWGQEWSGISKVSFKACEI